VIYRFTGGADGAFPLAEVVLDHNNNIYGTTYLGGVGPCNEGQYTGCGVVFKLSKRADSAVGWTEVLLYSFLGIPDGRFPTAGLVLDHAGNLYGTTSEGGSGKYCVGFGCGTVFQLQPQPSPSPLWKENILYRFYENDDNDGWSSVAGLTFDPSGNLYGATSVGGASYDGTVYELRSGGGSWQYAKLYDFGSGGGTGGPLAALFMDKAGNLYGTTQGDGAYGWGSVFRLTPGSGGWTETVLYSFTGGADGGNLYSNVVIDSNGNLYGTASQGGVGAKPCYGGNGENAGCGVVWEITP